MRDNRVLGWFLQARNLAESLPSALTGGVSDRIFLSEPGVDVSKDEQPSGVYEVRCFAPHLQPEHSVRQDQLLLRCMDHYEVVVGVRGVDLHQEHFPVPSLEYGVNEVAGAYIVLV